MSENQTVNELIRMFNVGQLNRRQLLSQAMKLGLSLPAISLLLAACTSAEPAAPAAGSDSAAAPSAGSSTPSTTESTAGAAAAASGKKLTIGVFSVNLASATINRCAKWIEKICQERGHTAVLGDGEGDFGKTMSIIENYVSSGVDAMINVASDNQLLGDAITNASKAGIIFGSMWSGVHPDAAFELGTTDDISTVRLATYMLDRLGRQGKVALLTWPNLYALRQRDSVLRALLSINPGVELVAEHTVKVPGQAQDAFDTVTNWLQRFPNKGDLDCIWGLWDEVGHAAVQALQAAGRDDIFVVTSDGAPYAVDDLRSDTPLAALIVNPIEFMGTTCVDEVEKIANTGKGTGKVLYADAPIPLTRGTVPADIVEVTSKGQVYSLFNPA